MLSYEREVAQHLVLTLGFSWRNAEIALEMFRDGALSRPEEEVINYIQLNPRRDGYPARFFMGTNYDNSHVRLMEHLNYSITMNGGDAVSKNKRRRR